VNDYDLCVGPFNKKYTQDGYFDDKEITREEFEKQRKSYIETLIEYDGVEGVIEELKNNNIDDSTATFIIREAMYTFEISLDEYYASIQFKKNYARFPVPIPEKLISKIENLSCYYNHHETENIITHYSNKIKRIMDYTFIGEKKQEEK